MSLLEVSTAKRLGSTDVYLKFPKQVNLNQLLSVIQMGPLKLDLSCEKISILLVK